MAIVFRFHVTSEILAVTAHPADHRFVEIPGGSVIETSDDLLEPGFHHITFNGKDLLAFARDIRERTEPVEV